MEKQNIHFFSVANNEKKPKIISHAVCSGYNYMLIVETESSGKNHQFVFFLHYNK